jgi:hypothetical protein
VKSEYQIAPVARAQKKRLLRQLGLKAGDLDGIANALLDNWARAHAKAVLMDDFFQARGFVTAEGELSGPAKIYFTALNTSRLALVRLSEHMRATSPKRELLADYIVEAYGNGDSDAG